MSELYHEILVREGFIGECLAKIGDNDPEEVQLLRDHWEDETQREVVTESLKAETAR
jgi:hypothetical protein